MPCHATPLLNAPPSPAQEAERERRHEGREREPYERRVRLRFPAPVGAIGGQVDLALAVLAAVDDDVVDEVGAAVGGFVAGAGVRA
jgi:hypothetical protein